MSRWFGGKALAIIFVTVLLDMMGIGIILPVLPSLIANLAGEGISNASMIGGWLFMAYSATQFLCGPMIGNLSDAYGRRPVLLLSILGLGVDYLVTAFAPTIGWLFVGRLLAGLCGASYTTASAYVADVTPPQDRAKAFGMLGAAFGIGFVLGPALGGLLGHFGPRTPFFFASGCSILNFAVAIFVLPESLGRDRRRPFAWRRANPLGAVLSLRRHPLLIRWALAIFLSFVAMAVYPAVLAFATIERYGWDATQIGLSLAFFGIVSALFQGGVVGPAIRVMGERRAALAGLIVSSLTAIGFAFRDRRLDDLRADRPRRISGRGHAGRQRADVPRGRSRRPGRIAGRGREPAGPGVRLRTAADDRDLRDVHRRGGAGAISWRPIPGGCGFVSPGDRVVAAAREAGSTVNG